MPFVIEIGSITPPSVQLLPAKRYTGAPIGTSYDIRVYTGNYDATLKLNSVSLTWPRIAEIMKLSSHSFLYYYCIKLSPTVPTPEQADERIQRRSTVRLGIRLIHKICPEISLSNNEPSQQPTVPRSLRLRLSPKARKLIKQTSLIIHGSSTNSTSNGNVKSIVEADVVDNLNRVSREVGK